LNVPPDRNARFYRKASRLGVSYQPPLLLPISKREVKAMTRLSWGIVGVFVILAASPNSLFAQARLASRFGEATVGGQRVIVHVTVAVPPGADENAVAEDALRGQGARPFQPADFTTIGLLWDQFFDEIVGNEQVTQHYNSANAPVAAETSLTNSQTTWTGVGTSRFVFSYGGTTDRCPSLVRECPGAQAFDTNNDLGWVNLGGCCTLAVTWYGTSDGEAEADVALNTRFPWATNGVDNYDVETVILHEIGHVLGLGHSSVSGSIMEAIYSGVLRTVQQDDERGATYLYPESGAVGDITGTVTALIGGALIAGARVRIADFPVSATTDAFGDYTLPGVPDIGTYTVTASAPGYKSQPSENFDVSTADLDFQLERRGQ
jgi:hypothetical protein